MAERSEVAAAGAGPGLATVPRRYRLEYALAAEPGAVLDAAAWRRDSGWDVRLTHAATGADLFRARVEPGEDVGASMEVEA